MYNIRELKFLNVTFQKIYSITRTPIFLRVHQMSKCACGWEGACHCAGSPTDSWGLRVLALARVLATAVSQVRNSQLCGSWSAESKGLQKISESPKLNAEKILASVTHRACMCVCVWEWVRVCQCLCLLLLNELCCVLCSVCVLVWVYVWALWAGEAHACKCVCGGGWLDDDTAQHWDCLTGHTHMQIPQIWLCVRESTRMCVRVCVWTSGLK